MTETLFILSVSVMFLLSFAFFAWYLINSRPRKIARRKALLEDSFERLKLISYELLKNVDEFDQAKQFESKALDSSSSSLKNISSDSALLSESLETIEHLLKKRKLDDANHILAASAKLAEKIQSDMNTLAPDGIVLKIESRKKEKQ